MENTQTLVLVNLTTGQPLADRFTVDASPLLGLMFRRSFERNEGIRWEVDSPSRFAAAIHMSFVFFPITVLWLDESGRVVDKVLAKPFDVFHMPQYRARYVVELHADCFSIVSIGDQIVLIDANAN